jgi:hypothetical protein
MFKHSTFNGKLRFSLLIFFIFIGVYLFAQEPITLPNDILPSTKGCERDPMKLVSKLIEGKDDEKEKFDVIFTWVAKNIHYDYQAYLSPHGTSMPQLKKILKYKKGICLDYAYLMDTLCLLAGIKNSSVYGYAKDDLFDVNDSIYIDNHAWNAVRLNNLWYVYDVTWSSGEYEWRLTKFSQYIYNLRTRISTKGISTTVVFKTTTKEECDSVTTEYSRTYSTLSLPNKFLLKLLSVFKLRKQTFFKGIQRPDFYLTDPEVFAITHFPNNSYWSLTSNYKTIADFEADSAYYYLNDTFYINQKREGRFCLECDNYFSLDDMAKEKQMKSNSYKFNKHNHFVTAMANFNMGKIYYKKLLPEMDSLETATLLDSTFTYLNKAHDDFRQSIVNIGREDQLQKEKNSKKLKILTEENKEHLRFIRSVIASTDTETGKMQRFAKKGRSTEISLRKKKSRVLDIPDQAGAKKFKEIENVHSIQLDYEKFIAGIDSIDNRIAVLKSSYSDIASSFSNNLWDKMEIQDSLIMSFSTGAYYRWLYSLDNYKKNIVDVRSKIKKFEDIYVNNLTQEIYMLSDSLTNVGFNIFNFFEARNHFAMESERLAAVLMREKIISKDSLKNFTKINADEIQENICWIAGKSSQVKSVVAGYKLLVGKQKFIGQLIKLENRAEYDRYRTISKEILRRKIRFKNIVSTDIKVCSKWKGIVNRYKRDYIKSLKVAKKKANNK